MPALSSRTHQVARCLARPSDAPRPRTAARRTPQSIPRATLQAPSETTMTLAEIEEDNARLKAELLALEREEEAALEQLKAENDLLRKLAFAKVKQLPTPVRASFVERYQGLVQEGSSEGLYFPTLPAELLSLTEEGEVPRAPIAYVQPVKATAAAPAIPTPAAAAAKAPAAAAPSKAAAAPEGAPKGTNAGWERVASDDNTEAYLKKGEDNALTFRFGQIMESIAKKIIGV